MLIHEGKLKNYIFQQVLNYVVVVSPSGKFYLIHTINQEPTRCTCKGYVYNNKCKHIEFCNTLDIKSSEVLQDAAIGVWLTRLTEYSIIFKMTQNKGEWYLSNPVPLP